MKKFIASLFAVMTFVAGSQAGPVEATSKEVQQSTYQPTQDWYRDREWNIDLFGAYAFSGEPYRTDRYLDADHAWGGGIDANYMFSRYLGVGVEGFLLDPNDVVGQASANLIFRYPIPNTRIAPYAYAGGGAIFNGSRVEDLVDRGDFRHNGDTEGMGQFGAGFEIRVTPHIGIINDFSWNVVNGDHNNFGMVRSGLRFAF